MVHDDPCAFRRLLRGEPEKSPVESSGSRKCSRDRRVVNDARFLEYSRTARGARLIRGTRGGKESWQPYFSSKGLKGNRGGPVFSGAPEEMKTACGG